MNFVLARPAKVLARPPLHRMPPFSFGFTPWNERITLGNRTDETGSLSMICRHRCLVITAPSQASPSKERLTRTDIVLPKGLQRCNDGNDLELKLIEWPHLSVNGGPVLASRLPHAPSPSLAVGPYHAFSLGENLASYVHCP